MTRSVRQLVVPAYLFLCLILGGSAQGVWGNMLLQLVGIAIIAWAAAARSHESLVAPARQMLLIVLAALLIGAAQLVPLPPSLWSHLGDRGDIAQGYRVLGLALPSLPLSLTPYKTLDSLLSLIPAIAVFCGVVRLKAYRGSWIAAAVLAGTIAGILLGILQVSSIDPERSPWYLYARTNRGFGVGFFANADHMATLLIVSLPFLAALVAAARSVNLQRYWAFIALAAGAGLVLVVGVVLNGSMAGYGLAVPVLAASALVVLPPRSRLRVPIALIAAVLMVGALVALSSTAIGGSRIGADASESFQSRADILKTSERPLKAFMPWGSGIGSFVDVYPRFEDAGQVTTTYVVHAHNDYAELALETGVPGILLLLAFLAWWAAASWRVWRSAEAGPFARTASIASAAILAHSLVDFPLRTAAISACFGMCLAFLADRRAPQAAHASDLRPTRHLVFR